MCVLIMMKNWENNGTEEIGLVTPTPGTMKNTTASQYDFMSHHAIQTVSLHQLLSKICFPIFFETHNR